MRRIKRIGAREHILCGDVICHGIHMYEQHAIKECECQDSAKGERCYCIFPLFTDTLAHSNGTNDVQFVSSIKEKFYSCFNKKRLRRILSWLNRPGTKYERFIQFPNSGARIPEQLFKLSSGKSRGE